jgi:hypothetical protein
MKPEHFREVSVNTCYICVHMRIYEHCIQCQPEYTCSYHSFNMGMKAEYICDDFEKDE